MKPKRIIQVESWRVLVARNDEVVSGESTDHEHFADEPPGSVLLQLHQRRLAEIEREEAERLAALRAVVSSSLRRPAEES